MEVSKKMKKAVEEILQERCVAKKEEPGAGVWRVLRRFFLDTGPKRTPAISLAVGTLVELSRITAHENFCIGRIEPVNPGIPETGRYAFTRPYTLLVDGEFRDFTVDDEVMLTRDEAIELLKKSIVKFVEEKETDGESKN